ncbi:hypothetical protein P171DRAFT_521149 [Karstenula rhodostoma CBS 690.94]|uniref:BTB domain-containing protein n=1 Tax=Karstenula rhodostoma CBS 690.94 TaxID=1392251 RepID=A0A9P4PJE5_9PLEO|nr:hypothetical protein P171DRAFT_521149 [Karstenula rhodostoma CBS 690.94]
MGSLPPPYRFFQSVFALPDDDSSAIASSPPTAPPDSDVDTSVIDPKLLDTLHAAAQTPVARQVQPRIPDKRTTNATCNSSIVEVVVRIPPTTQRTWYIQKSIISRHSAGLRGAYELASTTSVDLDGDTFSLATFQNFIDFSYSSIYSVNRQALDYHIIHTNVQAWLLGAKLEAPTYQAAALRELYTWIEPLSRAVDSSAAHSPIRVEDVDFVCRKTPDGCVLRALIFDAVAAHWTQHDAINIGTNLIRKFTRETAPEPDPQPPRTVEALTWASLYKHRGFRKRISSSLKVRDSQRTRLLRPVDDYIAGKTGMQEEEFVSEAVVSSIFGGPRPLRPVRAQGLMLSPGRRRRSDERSRRGRSTEREVDDDEFMTMEDA